MSQIYVVSFRQDDCSAEVRRSDNSISIMVSFSYCMEIPSGLTSYHTFPGLVSVSNKSNSLRGLYSHKELEGCGVAVHLTF
jgi:hypothetical protein